MSTAEAFDVSYDDVSPQEVMIEILNRPPELQDAGTAEAFGRLLRRSALEVMGDELPAPEDSTVRHIGRGAAAGVVVCPEEMCEATVAVWQGLRDSGELPSTTAEPGQPTDWFNNRQADLIGAVVSGLSAASVVTSEMIKQERLDRYRNATGELNRIEDAIELVDTLSLKYGHRLPELIYAVAISTDVHDMYHKLETMRQALSVGPKKEQDGSPLKARDTVANMLSDVALRISNS